MNKTLIILVNVGTPDNPDVKSVRRYLFQFLNDSRVMDIPWLIRKILVNLIIVPFRAKKSTELYKKIWNENGSPLKYYSRKAAEKLQSKLDNGYEVRYAMRYGNPSLKDLLNEINDNNYSEIVLVPLFPQYASSTTGTVVQQFLDEIKSWNIIPKIRIINQFYKHPAFIEAFAGQMKKHDISKYDHVLFSFHGLPLRQIQKSHPKNPTSECMCETIMPEHGEYCYKATCYETARLLAKRLNLREDSYSVSFQSRLTKDWLSPFTDEQVIKKAKSGTKNILLAAPAFVADCLETIVELEMEYGELFRKNGGDNLTLGKGLNDREEWIESLKEIIFYTLPKK